MRPRPRQGFTLIELLLVVFILAVLALSTDAMVNNAHEQARFDETRNRLEQIRQAIVGADDLSAPVAGYVADVGALPNSVRDLLERPDTISEYTTSPAWHFGSGWRGPYLRALPRSSDGMLEFPDGWGTPDDPSFPSPPGDPDFGWDWLLDASDPTKPRIVVRSAGPNASFDAATPNDDQSLVVDHDAHHVELRGWRVTAVVNVATDTTKDLALRLIVPNGTGGFDETANELLSEVRSAEALRAGDNEVTFVFKEARRIPHGVRAAALCTGTPPVIVPGQVLTFEVRARAPLPIWLRGRFTVDP